VNHSTLLALHSAERRRRRAGGEGDDVVDEEDEDDVAIVKGVSFAEEEVDTYNIVMRVL
jgi:hypothetical protein